MTHDIPSGPSDNPEYANEGLIFDDDVLLLEIINELDDFEGEDFEDIRDFIQNLNERMGRNDWIGSTVRLSGKMRIAELADVDDFKGLSKEGEGMQYGKDDEGPYLLANDLEIGLSLLSVDIDIDQDDNEDGEKIEGTLDIHPRIVFTFDKVDKILEGYAEMNSYEPGDFIMYPNDIAQMKFSRPSQEMVKEILLRDFPDIARQLRLTKKNPPKNDQERLEWLKSVHLDRDLELPTSIRMGIGRLIYGRWEIDPYATHRIIVDGVVHGVGEKGVLTQQVMQPGTRYNGEIVAIDMMLDGDQWTPHLLVAEPAAASEGYEASFIPISSVEKLTNLRPRRQRYGKTVMVGFAAPTEIYDFWLRLQDEELAGSERDKINQVTKDELTPFEDQFRDVTAPYIDSKRGLIIQPVNSEIATLFATYQDHTDAFSRDGVEYDQDTIERLLVEALVNTSELSIGDIIEVSGESEIVYVTKNTTEPSKLGRAVTLTGEFAGVVEAVFPTYRKSGVVTAAAMALVVIGAEVNDSSITYEDGVVFVKVAKLGSPSVAKLLQIGNTASK